MQRTLSYERSSTQASTDFTNLEVGSGSFLEFGRGAELDPATQASVLRKSKSLHSPSTERDHARVETSATYARHIPVNENVVFSARVVKMSRKGKRQRRILIMTSTSIMTLRLNGKMSRSTLLGSVSGVDASVSSNEVVFHVPYQFDYHLNVSQKPQMLSILDDLLKYRYQRALKVNYITSATLRHVVIGKVQAKKNHAYVHAAASHAHVSAGMPMPRRTDAAASCLDGNPAGCASLR